MPDSGCGLETIFKKKLIEGEMIKMYPASAACHEISFNFHVYQNKMAENERSSFTNELPGTRGEAIESRYKDVFDLQHLIAERIAESKKVDQVEEIRKSLGRNVFHLSKRLREGGIITDDLTGNKYFVSIGGLKGGGGSQSKGGDEVRANKLYQSIERIGTVFEEVNRLSLESGRLRTSVITLQNNSDYRLEFLRSKSENGEFYTDFKQTFGMNIGPRYFIDKGCCGGIVHTDGIGGPSIGSVSLKARAAGLDYTIILAWCTSVGGNNKAGGEVRIEDGAKDKFGNAIGHAWSPTADVISIKALATQEHNKTSGTESFVVASTRTFDVFCRFSNKKNGTYDFSFEKPLESLEEDVDSNNSSNEDELESPKEV